MERTFHIFSNHRPYKMGRRHIETLEEGASLVLCGRTNFSFDYETEFEDGSPVEVTKSKVAREGDRGYCKKCLASLFKSL